MDQLCGLKEDYATLAMVGEHLPEVEHQDGDDQPDTHTTALIAEIMALEEAQQEKEREKLQEVTDSPTLITQTAGKLRAYLLDVATSGGAQDLSERVGSYCTTERTTNESLAEI
jgi:hypothetical protein